GTSPSSRAAIKMVLQCRFYASPLPDVEDIVMVNFKKIANMGAYVQLLEYGNKGYIDLSKRRVYTADLLQYQERYAKAKVVNKILGEMAEELGYKKKEQLEDLYTRTAWYFDLKENRRAASYDVFKKALFDPTVLDECDITDDVKEKLIEKIRCGLNHLIISIRADIEVSCFTYEGIEAVKEALVEGKKCSIRGSPVKITLISSPHFAVTSSMIGDLESEKKEGLASVQACLNAIKEAIEKKGGNFRIKEPVRVDSGCEPKTAQDDAQDEGNEVGRREGRETEE
ncbi:hypothetical protein PMAYCL1PPCAC_22893, partial [Pristionchus mayeri]